MSRSIARDYCSDIRSLIRDIDDGEGSVKANAEEIEALVKDMARDLPESTTVMGELMVAREAFIGPRPVFSGTEQTAPGVGITASDEIKTVTKLRTALYRLADEHNIQLR